MAHQDLNDEILEITRQIRNHVSYFKEIGVQYIGGAAVPASIGVPAPATNEIEPASKAESYERGPESARPSVSGPMPDVYVARSDPANEEMETTSEENQMTLFGEPAGANSESGVELRKKSGGYSIPVLERLPADASLEMIRDDIGDCRRCRLCDHRTKIVFGEGNPKARLMFIGEGPGADEDVTGRPFVGRAGKLLDKVIASIGFRREDVYIANVVKCRPPENRTPERDEVAACEQFLFRQIACIKPKAIVALGAPALQCLFGSKDTITRSRGEWRDWNGIRVMGTYHPAYLLRVPDKKRETWEDMKKVRDYVLSGD
ncbi:MAG: uracil-DNA glycosylase [Blastocatellia bacterium]